MKNQIEHSDWMELTGRLKRLFGIELIPPQYIKERGEIKMSYKEQKRKKQFDISSGPSADTPFCLHIFMRILTQFYCLMSLMHTLKSYVRDRHIN